MVLFKTVFSNPILRVVETVGKQNEKLLGSSLSINYFPAILMGVIKSMVVKQFLLKDCCVLIKDQLREIVFFMTKSFFRYSVTVIVAIHPRVAQFFFEECMNLWEFFHLHSSSISRIPINISRLSVLQAQIIWRNICPKFRHSC